MNCFAILFLNLRFLSTALWGSPNETGPAAALAIAGLILGAWRPSAALFAFTLAVPLLTGLGQLSMLAAPAPVCLMFASLYLGIFLGNASRLPAGRRLPPQATPRKFNLRRDSRSLILVSIAGEILISAVLASLFVQMARNSHSSEFWNAFLHRPLFGFTDPFYFLTSALLWLQGLYYFTALVDPMDYGGLFSVFRERDAIGPNDLPMEWLAPAFAAYAITTAASFAYQAILHLPATARGQILYMPETSLPFEDSHAYGSVAVALFAAYIAVRQGRWRRPPYISWLIAGCLLYLSFASWSRAAWMVAAVVLLIETSHGLPKRIWFAIAASVAAVLVAFYAKWRDLWPIDHPVASRLGNLLRVDQPRIFLYHKAYGMLKERPFAGFGIGSCDLTSVQFASPDDPLGKVPGFAHNFLLQIAVEQGLGVALLYAALIVWILVKGLGQSRGRAELASPCAAYVRAAGVALAAYLVTQMTANSLNVYFSNQFFFWFLMAALAGWAFDPIQTLRSADRVGI